MIDIWIDLGLLFLYRITVLMLTLVLILDCDEYRFIVVGIIDFNLVSELLQVFSFLTKAVFHLVDLLRL